MPIASSSVLSTAADGKDGDGDNDTLPSLDIDSKRCDYRFQCFPPKIKIFLLVYVYFLFQTNHFSIGESENSQDSLICPLFNNAYNTLSVFAQPELFKP